MSRRARAVTVGAFIACSLGAFSPTATAAVHQPELAKGRTAIVLEPAAYDDLVEAGVQITPIGRARVKPYEGTVRITLPVVEVTDNAVRHGGGLRLSSDDASLAVRDVTIPDAGFVSGTVRGSEVGDIGRALLFFQAPSSSPLGDTSLRFTFTFASYLNASFDTDFVELGYFGYATTRLP